jgi:spore maturation protein CgeB
MSAAADMSDLKPLLLIGNSGTMHVAESLLYAARTMPGLAPRLIDVDAAKSSWRLLNSLSWRLRQRRLPHAGRVEAELVAAVRETSQAVVITTGLTPVSGKTIASCKDAGAVSLHISTDDPWNPGQFAPWHLEALVRYDIVFTPRTSNIADFESLGCRDVRFLPFGYDERLLEETGTDPDGPPPKILFVGGADGDRAAFFDAFQAAGGEASLIGAYWGQRPALSRRWLGHLPPRQVVRLTRAAAVNLILVRRSNRDGHVMRSLEAGVIGACLAVERTAEHERIFGVDGEAVRYFDSPSQAATLCRELLADTVERERLSAAVGMRIRTGGHSYRDRLTTILAAASGLKADPADEAAGGAHA